MGFPKSIKEEAMVRSARRCCVCREFKGLHLETHHITQEADGGTNTLDNAIVLCLDCHTSAGHYNLRHPRGTRFSPNELRKHREKHWDDVASGRIAQRRASTLAKIHVRHLICLSYGITKEILNGEWDSNPFAFRNVMMNEVADFMAWVLKDDLPFPHPYNQPGGPPLSTSGRSTFSDSWDSRDSLVADYPEFQHTDSRPVQMGDFNKGRIRSKLLHQCAQFHDPADLGALYIGSDDCGGSHWLLEYRLRRPVFVFAEIWNRSDHDVTLVGGSANISISDGDFVAPFGVEHTLAKTCTYAPLLLPAGEAVAIPQRVLLTGTDLDGYGFEWSKESAEHPVEKIDFWGYRPYQDSETKDTQMLSVGPCHEIKALDFVVEDDQSTLEVHTFNPGRVYLAERAWMIGSCPHAVVELSTGEFVHLGEVLSDGWCSTRETSIDIPPESEWLHICEFEPEVTHISSLLVNNKEMLERSVIIKRNEKLSISVKGGDIVRITGQYRSAFQRAWNSLQLRQKRSFIASGLKCLVDRGA